MSYSHPGTGASLLGPLSGLDQSGPGPEREKVSHKRCRECQHSRRFMKIQLGGGVDLGSSRA